MSDFPQSNAPTNLFVNVLTMEGPGFELRAVSNQGQPGTITWVANYAVYMPFVIRDPYPVNRVFWVNGSTITTSNADFGIYTPDGTRIYSTGSTALSGVSVPQFVSPGTPFILAPGRYYFAYVCDNTTSRSVGWTPTVARQRTAGLLSQATALPLPATATFAAPSQAVVPFIGVTRTTTGF